MGKPSIDTAINAEPDAAEWAAVKADLQLVARRWHDAGKNEKAPDFILSEDWVRRVLAMPGIASKGLDYLGGVASSFGRLTIHNGLRFVAVEDEVQKERAEAKAVSASISGSSLMLQLANRAPGRK